MEATIYVWYLSSLSLVLDGQPAAMELVRKQYQIAHLGFWGDLDTRHDSLLSVSSIRGRHVTCITKRPVIILFCGGGGGQGHYLLELPTFILFYNLTPLVGRLELPGEIS